MSWDQAQGFLGQINQLVPGLDLALPSEAQWEYACRAGTDAATYAGAMEILGDNNAPVLDAIAWYGGNSGVEFDLTEGADSSGWREKQYPHEQAGTHPVGLKAPNAWGLYDMLGNVWEWCEDHWHDSYEGAPIDGSAWVDAEAAGITADRVIRGGSWLAGARCVRAAFRGRREPGAPRRRPRFSLCPSSGVSSAASEERRGSDGRVRPGGRSPGAHEPGAARRRVARFAKGSCGLIYHWRSPPSTSGSSSSDKVMS